jgi:multicomponent Na+:H+ antiporter subunit A
MTSLILVTGMRAVFHTILLLSLYLLFAGHNLPGGGFIGGLIAAAAVVLLYLCVGAEGLQRTVRIAPQHLLGLGVLLAVGTGAAALLFGAAFLQSGMWDLPIPLVGELHIPSVLVFDVGVYCVVVGLVMAVLTSLGADLEAQP